MVATESQPEAMSSAETVVVLVHGVGDHTHTDILSHLDEALRGTAPHISDVVRLKIPGFPVPNGVSSSQEAMRITIGEGQHFIIPVIWSRVRLRAAAALEFFEELLFPSRIRTNGGYNPVLGDLTPTAILATTLMVLPSLVFLFVDFLRCLSRCRRAWISALLTVAVAAFGLTILLFSFAFLEIYLFYVYMSECMLADLRASEVAYFCMLKIAVYCFLGPIVVVGAFVLLMPMLDLVGDVAFYVGNQSKRRTLETAMLAIIEFVSQKAPKANLVIIGHSLGTVLVTHTAYGLAGPPAERNLFLVTLGSPLKLLARIFPGSILAPIQLLDRYRAAGSVVLWANMWRSHDLIGQSLKTQSERFVESCLGNGFHRNYWRDKRLWSNLILMISAQRTDKLQALIDGWRLKGDERSGGRSSHQNSIALGSVTPATPVRKDHDESFP